MSYVGRVDTTYNMVMQAESPFGSKLTVTEAITAHFIRLIMDGRFKPGDQLPTESELANQFQVSRGAVREAFKALGVLGLVRVARGKGTFIGQVSNFLIGPLSLGLNFDAELESLIEARMLVEVKLAGLAANNATSEDIQAIQEYLQKMRCATRADQSAIFLEADIGFHFAIAGASGNRILAQFLTLIRNLMHAWISTTLKRPGVAQEALHDHELIFEAIVGRHPIRACRAMRRHLLRMASEIRLGRQKTGNGPWHEVDPKGWTDSGHRLGRHLDRAAR